LNVKYDDVRKLKEKSINLNTSYIIMGTECCAKCSKLYVGTRCKTVDWFRAAAVQAASPIVRCEE